MPVGPYQKWALVWYDLLHLLDLGLGLGHCNLLPLPNGILGPQKRIQVRRGTICFHICRLLRDLAADYVRHNHGLSHALQ